MKTSLMIAIAAGAACTAMATEPTTTSPTQFNKIAGNVYINLATGERTISRTGDRYGAPVWTNIGQCAGNFFWGGWTAVGTTREAIDWGSIADGTVIDGYQFGYASGMSDPSSSGIPGFNSINYFYDDYLGFGITGTIAAGYLITDLPGSYDGQYWGWIITIDLAGGNEFTLAGADANCGDGLHEFGWGTHYDIPIAGTTGPLLTAPDHLGMCGTTAACSTGNATGVEDAFDDYFAYPQTSLNGTFFFGGFDIATSTPAGSFWMELYSSGGNQCPPDWNGDTVLNSSDFIAFLNDFVAGNADYNGDTITNSSDFIAFLNDFVAGC